MCYDYIGSMANLYHSKKKLREEKKLNVNIPILHINIHAQTFDSVTESCLIKQRGNKYLLRSSFRELCLKGCSSLHDG